MTIDLGLGNDVAVVLVEDEVVVTRRLSAALAVDAGGEGGGAHNQFYGYSKRQKIACPCAAIRSSAQLRATLVNEAPPKSPMPVGAAM